MKNLAKDKSTNNSVFVKKSMFKLVEVIIIHNFHWDLPWHVKLFYRVGLSIHGLCLHVIMKAAMIIVVHGNGLLVVIGNSCVQLLTQKSSTQNSFSTKLPSTVISYKSGFQQEDQFLNQVTATSTELRPITCSWIYSKCHIWAWHFILWPDINLNKHVSFAKIQLENIKLL